MILYDIIWLNWRKPALTDVKNVIHVSDLDFAEDRAEACPWRHKATTYEAPVDFIKKKKSNDWHCHLKDNLIR